MTSVTTKLRRQRMSLATFMARPRCEGRTEELIDGELVVSPTPRWRHNEMVLLLAAQLAQAIVEPGLGRVSGPQTVVLGDRLALAPDLCVLLADQLHLLRDGYPHGAPAMVVEVLSPSNRSNDLIRKKRLYAEHGVREYWIVDGDAETVTRYLLHRGRYGRAEVRRRSIRMRILPQVRVDLLAIWRAVRGL